MADITIYIIMQEFFHSTDLERRYEVRSIFFLESA